MQIASKFQISACNAVGRHFRGVRFISSVLKTPPQVRAAPLVAAARQQQRCLATGSGGMYPKIYEGAAVPPTAQELTPAQKEMLQLGTALRNIGWLSFWSQLILTSVSAVILLFSVGVTSQGSLSINPIDIFTFVGVAAGLLTTGLSWTWIRAGRRLAFLQEIKLQQCMATVLASTNLNLIGMGAAILGLQATVGALVAKTLSASASYYGPKAAPPPVAFDVFSVQACANTIMSHFVGMVLAQWLLRTVSRFLEREEARAMEPSAPPMPLY